MTDWKAVQQRLFGAGEAVYAVIDGASVPDFRQQAFNQSQEIVCLFRGELKDDMAEVAPYLTRLDPEGAFTEWILQRGWGNHWGIFLSAGAGIDALRRHFRGLLIVHDETGKPLRFRYYDPRVLATFLPTCAPGEIAEFFGPVDEFLFEGAKPSELLAFRNDGGKLNQDRTILPEARST